MAAAASAGLRRPQAAVVIADMTPPAAPCGLCRQTLASSPAISQTSLSCLVNLQGERQETDAGGASAAAVLAAG